MTDIEPGTLLVDPARAGICFVDTRERDAMADAALASGLKVVTVDLSAVRDKHTLIDAIAAALEFPPESGHNWDALADSLGDLSWLPAEGYLLLLDHVGAWRTAEPDQFATALEILDDAARTWSAQRVPFWTLVPLSAQALDEVVEPD